MSRWWSGARCAAIPVVAITIAWLTSCGADASGQPLSPEASRGRELARTNGCSACHGSDGQGGVGPPFVGLYGSSVRLADGSTVVADDAYVAEAIQRPDAARPAGYDVAMPSNDLSDEQVAALVAYIRELGGAGANS
jgi:cytochrome c oxidase subunit II